MGAARRRMTIVVFADEGRPSLLGAYTLEGFGLAPDPVNRRLIPVRGLAMRLGVGRRLIPPSFASG